MTPLEAATHPDPYPFYADLAGNRPLYFDEAISMWVASSAANVAAILADDRMAVRPSAEPVPSVLSGLRSGDVFADLMRMTDGPVHSPLKRSAFHATSHCSAAECADTTGEVMNSRPIQAAWLNPRETARNVMFAVPTFTVGTLLGVAPEQRARLLVEVAAFAAGISPIANPEQRQLGHFAAIALSGRIEQLMEGPGSKGRLLATFLDAAAENRIEHRRVIANVVGFLFQTYEATAGLVGNAIRLLAAMSPLRETLSQRPDQLGGFVNEVMRFDPPAQNTRRFPLQDVELGGQVLKSGSQILVVLAAASRDPARYESPMEFRLDRNSGPGFGFGAGRHQCPGEPFAKAIAGSVIGCLLSKSFDWESLAGPVVYRPSLNARIPLY